MIARILALFIGLFIAINLLGNLIWPGFDANVWWIHFAHWLPAWIAKSFAGHFRRGTHRVCLPKSTTAGNDHKSMAAVAATLAIVALLNAISFYWLLGTGRNRGGISTAVVAGCLWRADLDCSLGVV